MGYEPTKWSTVAAILLAVSLTGCNHSDGDAPHGWLGASPRGGRVVDLYLDDSSSVVPKRVNELSDDHRAVLTLHVLRPEITALDLRPLCVRVKLHQPLAGRRLVDGARGARSYRKTRKKARRRAAEIRRLAARGNVTCRTIPNR